MVEYYSKFGFDPQAEAKRLQQLGPQERVREFNQQRESYLNHLTEDQAVSIKYSYWLDAKGEIFTSSDTNNDLYNIKDQIDLAERNGLFYNGVLKAAKQAKETPNDLIVLYSPTGKKLFDDTPRENIAKEKFDFLEKPYDVGQLYFLCFDGKKIDNVAVSINSNDNPWLKQLGLEIPDEENEEKRIGLILNSPKDIGNIDDFFTRLWPENLLIYHNVHQQNFYLDEVLLQMKKVFSGKEKIAINTYDKTLRALQQYQVTADMIANGYLTVLYNHMTSHVQPIGGGCGGSIANKSEIKALLGLETEIFPTTSQLISSFSTTYRNITQNKAKNWEYHNGCCVVCGKDPAKVGPCNICVDCEKKYD